MIAVPGTLDHLGVRRSRRRRPSDLGAHRPRSFARPRPAAVLRRPAGRFYSPAAAGGDPALQWASRQFAPTPTSTTSGTRSGNTASIRAGTRRRSSATSALRGLEDQLVVDLQDHPGPQARGRELRVDLDHRLLDQVGRGALDHAVHGHPLGGVLERAVARREVRQVAAPAEQGAHEALAARRLDRLVEEAAHAPVAREVGVDRRLRLAARDAELVRETEGRRAVDDPEVDRLGARALLGRDRLRRDAGRPRPPCAGGCPRRGGTPRSGSRRPSSARGCAARPASSRPRAAAQPSAGTKASRMRTPSGLRIGMFWTFGWVAESRPVAAPSW